MKIELIDRDVNINGTSLQGYVTATFDQLVSTFGKPAFDSTVDGQSDKVHTQWALEFEDAEGNSVRATIYDWKEDSAFNSRVGDYRWHIGGDDYTAEDAVASWLK